MNVRFGYTRPSHQEIECWLQAEGRLLGLVAVGDQSRHKVNQEIVRATMAGVLDLADVLELVVDALNERPLAKQQFVGVGEPPFAHVLAHFGDQPQPMGREELFGERLGDIVAVAEELPEQASRQAGNGTAVIDIAWGQAHGQHLAAVVDHQMQLEPIEPADRGLAAARRHERRGAAQCGRSCRRSGWSSR